MLESGAEAEADSAAIEQRLKDNKTEEVRVAVASGGLREKLQRLEGQLHEIASRYGEPRPDVDAHLATRSAQQTHQERAPEDREPRSGTERERERQARGARRE